MAKKKKSAGAVRTEADLYKTEEQRKAYMEMLMARRKEVFEREQRSAKLNSLKIQGQWRDLMKKVKSEALCQQLEILKQVHERHVDRKNHTIQESAVTLREADEQYDAAYQAHLQNVDNLLDLQYARLDALERDFEMELKELEMEFGSERVKLQAQHVKEKNDILGVIYRMDADFTETEADSRHEYQSSRDDVKNKNLEEKHALRIQLESAIEDLWRQFQQALTNYTAATDERKRQFEDLKAKDEQSAQLIETQLRKLGKLAESVSALKGKLASNAKDADSRIVELRTAKERVVVDFQALKRKMNGYRDAEKRKRIELTRIANTSTKQLEKQFHKRYNKVLLDKLALEAKREKLLRENESLRAVLQAYLDGISVREKIMEEANPLVVVNGKTNIILPKRQPRVITVVEGGAAVKNASRMLAK
ncbi:hypothetical protein BCR44DRAFT_63502 [Catenaria anguillulae PL171]|uniref:Dynein regulatory complex subunit 2 n=1 Tax=Catenaria anguillulae PL171 TaxID=765915 RepID=A0A1Y2HFC1_9FUNG|nr:hypothetical protein BCR44DRAFT_63502 [Catenaria anguillulae PL171]